MPVESRKGVTDGSAKAACDTSGAIQTARSLAYDPRAYDRAVRASRMLLGVGNDEHEYARANQLRRDLEDVGEQLHDMRECLQIALGLLDGIVAPDETWLRIVGEFRRRVAKMGGAR